jgi:hypothetical protein
LLSSLILGLLLAFATKVLAGTDNLPVGDSPPALRSDTFPDTLHEFIWRNWEAVEPAKLARLLGASEEQVIEIALSMGLPRTPVVSPHMLSRGYLSLIRRNWHLLPYEQLLELLEMDADRLDTMLREEDFLWVKLGRRKPSCEPIHYSPPNDEAKARAAEIRSLIEEEFGQELLSPAEPRFDFVRQLSSPLGGFDPLPPSEETDRSLRIVYSYVAVYGDPLLHPELDPYPEGLLQRLAKVGINGVWLQGVLRDLAPGGEEFPEFGQDHRERLANLRVLVERAARYGIQVFLYINEPRAMPHSFFESHPEVGGVGEAELRALCTSRPAVRRWMGDALAFIFEEVPDLGGVYAITASENLTNCASHGDWKSCPHCSTRTDSDILAEVVSVIEEGVHRGNPEAAVLISDWGWKGHGDASDIIPLLPSDIALMSVSEWSLPIERGGISSVVGEYSISSVGPGPRALPHWNQARERGLGTGAEIQFNNTCEIASIPYIPVLDLVAEHCRKLYDKAHLQALLIGWTMGGHPSPNIALAERLNRSPAPSVEEALEELARERYGAEGAPLARRAWTILSEAYREYPFHISVVYTSPVQWGPANPLYPNKTGYSATMWGLPYDDLNSWRGPYPAEVLADQFEKVAQGWEPGLALLGEAVEKTPADLRKEAESDLRLGQAAAIHFQSVANQTRFVLARDTLEAASGTLSAAEAEDLRESMRDALVSEIELCHRLFRLVREDSRIGFEPSCQYFYLPLDLVSKVLDCRRCLDRLEQ